MYYLGCHLYTKADHDSYRLKRTFTYTQEKTAYYNMIRDKYRNDCLGDPVPYAVWHGAVVEVFPNLAGPMSPLGLKCLHESSSTTPLPPPQDDPVLGNKVFNW